MKTSSISNKILTIHIMLHIAIWVRILNDVQLGPDMG